MRVQSGRRSRGRNRKGPSPLSRSYESNGPDVKIRGTASHIADKYTQLARDAHASGDTIACENYHQHAEHYLRIIAAAQAQVQTNERQDNPDRQQSGDQDRQQSGDDTGANADASANGQGNGRGEDAAEEPSAEATSDGQSRDRDQDQSENQDAPRRRRRRAPRATEAASDKDEAVTGQSTNGGSPYPADQPQPEVDEPA